MTSLSPVNLLRMKRQYLPLVLSTFVLVSCTDSRPKHSEQRVFQQTNLAQSYDQNSSFGELEVSEIIWTGSADQNAKRALLDLIEKQINEDKSKKFIILDIGYKQKENAETLAKDLSKSLQSQDRFKFDISIEENATPSLREHLSVKVTSVHIKPRDCSPEKVPLGKSIGGYFEAKFGCTYANNISAMLDNPRDATVPRGSEPVNAQRVIRILRSYIEGTATGTAISESEVGEASKIE